MAKYSSLGSVLKQTIAAALVVVAGIRDVTFDSPEIELMEVDDLASDYVDQDPTGRSKGGSVKGSLFFDPASATNTALIALYNTPVKTAGVFVPTAWSIDWQAAAVATQLFSGILVKQSRKAERGSALMSDLEITITRKPTLV